MRNLLIINSSPNSESSTSRDLTAAFADAVRGTTPDVQISHRDVGQNPLPHVTQDMVNAYYTPEDQRTPEQEDAIAESEGVVDEVVDADAIVIGAPMHNFTITSSLKTWIDHLARVGRTFNYTENGPVGKLGGRKGYVLTSRGDSYQAGAPAASMDMQEPYLRTLFGFLGLTDLTFVHAEGMAGSSNGKDRAIDQIQTLVSQDFRAAA